MTPADDPIIVREVIRRIKETLGVLKHTTDDDLEITVDSDFLEDVERLLTDALDTIVALRSTKE